jgi:hypothetical protein
MKTIRQTALAILFCGVSATLSAQQRPPGSDSPLLQRRAGLDIRDVSLEEALSLLRMRSGVSLAFSSDHLRGRALVDCACTEVTVGEALDTLLAGTGLKYHETPNRVVVGTGGGRLIRAEDKRPEPARGTIAGLVLSAEDSVPIPSAAVQVVGRLGEVRTDAEGHFRLSLAPGTYEITVKALGYTPSTLYRVRVVDGEVNDVIFVLTRTALRLRDIVVTPSTYGILTPEAVATQQTLTRDEINNRPHFGEDLYRSLYHLPGVVTHDVSAKLQVRGSNNNEILQTLDGLELYEPLHLKDLGGAASIIDVEAVADLNLSTGGFTADYGDKLAGVFAMRSATPLPDRTTTTLGVSLMTFSAKSQGGFAGGKGTWLFSARRGFLDVVLRLLGATEDIKPTYYDFFTKTQYQLNQRHLVSVHALYAGDKFFMLEGDDTEIHSGWGSSYAWVNWHADFSTTVSAHTVLSTGRVTRDRSGQDFFDWDTTWRELQVEDRATLDFFGLRQDWSLLLSDRFLLRWGFDAKRATANYDYIRWRLNWIPNLTNPFAPPWSPSHDSLTVDLKPTGQELAAYISGRSRPLEQLTTEFGLRHDYQSHTGDQALSPRINVALDIAPTTVLRGAWGSFYQSHDLRALDVMNGVTQFYPAQRAEHRILGLSHAFRNGTSIRIEAYERRISNPWPEYRDLQPEMTDVVQEEHPEHILRVDPTRGLARGIEFLVKRDAGGPFAWAATYALAEAEDEIDGEWIPRPRDQRHAVHLEFALRPNASWSLSGGWHYHSAWPGTQLDFEVRTLANGEPFSKGVFGPMHALRLPAYHRLDLRASRHLQLGRGRLTLFIDIFNLYGRPNVETYEYFMSVETDRLNVFREYEDMIGVLPNIGARWEF